MAAFFLAGSPPARADGAHVANRCPRLSAVGYEELDARVLLLLQGQPEQSTPRPLPSVVCQDKRAWVEWGGQRFDIMGRGPLADEVVDIVEAHLGDAKAEARGAEPTSLEDRAVSTGTPVLERGSGTAPPLPSAAQPADRVATRSADARGGGIALGIETEMPSEDVPVAAGPTFDFGTTLGPLIFGGREAFRFSDGGRVFMDFEALAAYGAPFNPHVPIGAVLRFGAEWVVQYPEGNSGQAAVIPVFEAGLRAAHNFGAISGWFGVDARFRLRRFDLSAPANDVGGSLTVGIAFIDWSRKQREQAGAP